MSETTEATLPAVKQSDRETLPAMGDAARRGDVPAPRERAPSPRRGQSRADETKTVSEIAGAIAKIMSEVGVVAKKGENKFHGYKYARMSDVLIRLTPLLAQHGIVFVQNELERSMFDDNRVLAVQYEFTISHSSGEVWPERPRQTGVCRCRDSKGGWDDKAFNKAHTAARKYFLLALFQIATDEMDAEDADEDSYLAHAAARTRWPPKPAPNAMQEHVDPETGEVKPVAPSATGTAAAAPASDAGDAAQDAGAAQNILEMARAAADRGEKIFRQFYRNRNGAEQASINAIGDELRKRMAGADKETK